MKKGLYLLGILLLPLVVYAEESISEAYYIGLLTTIPITVFLLLPIASLMSKTSQEMFKKTIILFFIRAAILLVVTPFYPDITELEGFLFIFTFILSPISITRINKFPSTPLAINGVVTSGSVLSTGLLETTYPSSMVCPKCGKVVAYGNAFCPQCRYDFKPLFETLSNIGTKHVCSVCNKIEKPNAKYCSECGGNILNIVCSDNIKFCCEKCGEVFEKNTETCEKCGGSIIRKDNINGIELIYRKKDSISIGHPIDISEFNPIIFDGTIDQSLTKYIDNYVNANIQDSNKLTLSSIETRKIIMTIVYAIVLSIIIALYAAYHTNIALVLFVFVVSTIIYFLITKKYNIKKSLIKEIKSRPDEKMDYVISSTYSGAIYKSSSFTFIRMIILALFLGVSVLLFSEPHMVYEKSSDGNGYVLRYYTLGLLKTEKKITVPSEYKNQSVVGIRGDVFKNVTTVEEVELPDSIVEIRGGAFQNCYKLRNINLPPYITEIHGSTFENCYSLQSIIIPEGVTRIGGSAFRECSSLVEVTIPKTVTEIGSSAFRGTMIGSVCISKNAFVNERAFKETNAHIVYYENDCKDGAYSGDDYYGGYGN